MSQNYSSGVFAAAQWTPTGLAQSTLNIRGHSLDLSVQLFDVSNTGVPGGRSRMAGLNDVAGTINTWLDLDAPFYGIPLFLAPAVRGICAFGMSAIRYIQTPVIVEKLHYATTVEQSVEQSADVKMDARSGLIVYPPV